MKKWIGIFLGLLILGGFAGIVWLLYKNFGSTLIVILNILIMMTGVLLAILVYTRITEEKKEDTYPKNKETFPAIESDLIQVNPEVFCDNLEEYKGDLHLLSSPQKQAGIYLKKGHYNKLTDEVTLIFTDGLKTKIKGIPFFAVGEEQFLFYDFEEMLHYDGGKTYRLQKSGKTILEKQGNTEEEHPIPKKSPVFIFDWSLYEEEE